MVKKAQNIVTDSKAPSFTDANDPKWGELSHSILKYSYPLG